MHGYSFQLELMKTDHETAIYTRTAFPSSPVRRNERKKTTQIIHFFLADRDALPPLVVFVVVSIVVF